MPNDNFKMEQAGSQPAHFVPINPIKALLVQKYLFTTIGKDGRKLTKCGLTFLDSNGRTLDVDVWSVNEWTKAQYLYIKLKPNNVYEISNCARLIPPNKKYSNSQFRIASVRRVRIEKLEPSPVFKLRSFLPCTTSVAEASRQIEERATVNILATYVARHRGPRKFLDQSRDAIASGHMVEFEDRNSVRFFVLLWQPRNISAPYHLYAAEPGEVMLIPNCRAFNRPLESNRYVQNPKALHFTTLCHAVSNSWAVGPEKLRELRRNIPKSPTKGQEHLVKLSHSHNVDTDRSTRRSTVRR